MPTHVFFTPCDICGHDTEDKGNVCRSSICKAEALRACQAEEAPYDAADKARRMKDRRKARRYKMAERYAMDDTDDDAYDSEAF